MGSTPCSILWVSRNQSSEFRHPLNSDAVEFLGLLAYQYVDCGFVGLPLGGSGAKGTVASTKNRDYNQYQVDRIGVETNAPSSPSRAFQRL